MPAAAVVLTDRELSVGCDRATPGRHDSGVGEAGAFGDVWPCLEGALDPNPGPAASARRHQGIAAARMAEASSAGNGTVPLPTAVVAACGVPEVGQLC
jgi:hypothetical protein